MTPPPTSVPQRIEELHLEARYARGRALAYLGGALPVATLTLLGAIGPPAALVTAIAAVAAAALWLGHQRHSVARRRQVVDELILHGWRNSAPDEVRARERELVALRYRRVLARALERRAGDAARLPGFTLRSQAVAFEIARQRGRIMRVARRLRDTRPVDPRGVVIVAHLLADGLSPLHAGPTHAIGPALERAERALDEAEQALERS
jgi:hypothetical protein